MRAVMQALCRCWLVLAGTGLGRCPEARLARVAAPRRCMALQGGACAPAGLVVIVAGADVSDAFGALGAAPVCVPIPVTASRCSLALHTQTDATAAALLRAR